MRVEGVRSEWKRKGEKSVNVDRMKEEMGLQEDTRRVAANDLQNSLEKCETQSYNDGKLRRKIRGSLASFGNKSKKE